MPELGLREARNLLVAALRSGRFQFEAGEVREGKNLLQIGVVTVEDVVRLLGRCRGDQFSASPHHYDRATWCYVFKPLDRQGVTWYVKAYFLDDPPDHAVVISVHIAEQ